MYPKSFENKTHGVLTSIVFMEWLRTMLSELLDFNCSLTPNEMPDNLICGFQPVEMDLGSLLGFELTDCAISSGGTVVFGSLG